MQLSNVAQTSKVDNCYFENPKYPMNLSNSSVEISNSFFNRTTTGNFGSTPAIKLNTFGSPKITNCDFFHYEIGIELGIKNSTVEITLCTFHQDSSLWSSSFQMVSGVKATGWNTTAKIRDCCFLNVTSHAVYGSGISSPDLGTVSDLGGNSFFFQCLDKTPQYCVVWAPAYAVFQQSGFQTLQAQGNFWETNGIGDTTLPSNWVMGPIDTSNSLLGPATGCNASSSQQNNTKLSGIDENGLPFTFIVNQNYPNPFNPSTMISYTIPGYSHVKVEVYNILGQIVATLVDIDQDAGEYQVTWDSKSSSGQLVSTGVYLYRITAGEFSATRKMILMK